MSLSLHAAALSSSVCSPALITVINRLSACCHSLSQISCSSAVVTKLLHLCQPLRCNLLNLLASLPSSTLGCLLRKTEKKERKKWLLAELCIVSQLADLCIAEPCIAVQGLAGIVGNPVLSQAIAGLATSATAQATLERVMLFDLKDKIIEPFGETAQQVFARISAMRDSLDGPQVRLLPGAAAMLTAMC